MGPLRQLALVCGATLVAISVVVPASPTQAAIPSAPNTSTTPLLPAGEPAITSRATIWEPCDAFGGSQATSTIYLPNITKTLGGPGGWDTPFYIQNVGTSFADVDVSFYRFSDGSLVTCRTARFVSGSEIVPDDPNTDLDLPDDTQFAVVVKSYGSPVVAMVNQRQGSGPQTQALSYTGFSVGAKTVYLPNVTRRFFGYDVPFIVQNMGQSDATVIVSFVSFDNTKTFQTSLQIGPGRSGVIDPDYTPGLADGTQYAVTLQSNQPIGVVVNAHNEAIGPVAFSHNGLANGGTTLWGPYAMKNGPNGIFSPIVVQNVGNATVDATLSFTPIDATGAAQSFVLTGIPAGGARAFDPRFTFGTTTPCATASATCLGGGEYSLKITASTAVAAVVLPNSNTTAAAYLAAANVDQRSYMPIVQRRVGGWTGSIYLQSATATSVDLRFHGVADYDVHGTQTVTLSPGVTKKVDPALVSGLSDGSEYGVVAESANGTFTAIVFEQAPTGGDASMIYEGFALPPEHGPFVRGTVRGPAGAVPGVFIDASIGGFIMNSGVTNQAGEFAIPVPSGAYRLFFKPPESTRLVRQFHDGALSSAEATFVVVGDQDTTVDETLRAGSYVSGRVTAQIGGGPVTNVGVFAFRADCAGCSTVLSAQVDTTGSYRVLVPPGGYKLRFFPNEGVPYLESWYPGASSSASAQTVVVSGDVPNINGSLASGFRIAGTVRDSTQRGVRGVAIRVRSGGGATCCVTIDTATTDALGRYTAIVPSGAYKVSFTPPGLSGLATQWQGGATSFLTSPDVTVSGGDVINIDATLPRGGTMTGRTIYQGIVVTNVTVQVYAANEPCCNNLVYAGVSDAYGQYAVGLMPGTYRVRFISGSSEKWYQTGTSFSTATNVTVTTGVLSIIEAPLP